MIHLYKAICTSKYLNIDEFLPFKTSVPTYIGSVAWNTSSDLVPCRFKVELLDERVDSANKHSFSVTRY